MISAEQIEIDESDALRDEIASFVQSVQTRRHPEVGPAAGLRVMELSERIVQAIRETSRERNG